MRTWLFLNWCFQILRSLFHCIQSCFRMFSLNNNMQTNQLFHPNKNQKVYGNDQAVRFVQGFWSVGSLRSYVTGRFGINWQSVYTTIFINNFKSWYFPTAAIVNTEIFIQLQTCWRNAENMKIVVTLWRSRKIPVTCAKLNSHFWCGGTGNYFICSRQNKER